MNNSKVIVLAGAALLCLGVFLPIITVARIISVNWLSAEGLDMVLAIVTLGLGVVAALLALTNKTRHAVWPGLGALALIAFEFFAIRSKLGEAQTSAVGDAAGSEASARIASAMADAVSMSYGWVVLALGAILIIAGGAIAWKSVPPPGAA